MEETGLSGVDDGGGDQRTRERWSRRERRGLRVFWDKKRNDTGQATIYMFENISSDSSSVIDLESVPKRFWFKTATDEGIISRGEKLEPLLIS
jgi:hypothetical protein